MWKDKESSYGIRISAIHQSNSKRRWIHDGYDNWALRRLWKLNITHDSLFGMRRIFRRSWKFSDAKECYNSGGIKSFADGLLQQDGYSSR